MMTWNRWTITFETGYYNIDGWNGHVALYEVVPVFPRQEVKA